MKISHKLMKSLRSGNPTRAAVVALLLCVGLLLNTSLAAQAAQSMRSGYAGMTDKEFMAAGGTAGDPNGGNNQPNSPTLSDKPFVLQPTADAVLSVPRSRTNPSSRVVRGSVAKALLASWGDIRSWVSHFNWAFDK